MTRGEQIKFVEELVKTVKQDVINSILDEKIPGEWDGVELREYLEEKFKRSTTHMHRARRSAYNNTVLVNNL